MSKTNFALRYYDSNTIVISLILVNVVLIGLTLLVASILNIL